MKKTFIAGLVSISLLVSNSLIALAETTSSAQHDPTDIKSVISDAIITQRDESEIEFEITEEFPSLFRSEVTEGTVIKGKIIALNEQGQEYIRSVGSRLVESDYKEATEESYTVTIYSQVTYSKTTSSGIDYLSISKVTGGINAGGSGSNVGSGVTISRNSVTYGQWGKILGGTIKNQSTSKQHANGARSWSITPPNTWKPIEADSAQVIGCAYSVSLTRGSTWSISLDNSRGIGWG